MTLRPGRLDIKIYEGDYIAEDVKIGQGTQIGAGHDIGKGVVIGENCRIQCGVSIPNGTKIGDRVFIGPQVGMANDKNPQLHLHSEDDSHLEPPIIEDDVTIGLGARIGAGVHIGQGAVIGQGANVIKSVPAYTCVISPNAAEFYAHVDRDGKLQR